MDAIRLVRDLYKDQDNVYLGTLWRKFMILSPKLSYLSSKPVRRVIESDDRTYPIEPIRFFFFPDQTYYEANEGFRNLINNGIDAINSLSSKYLDASVAEHFALSRISCPLDVYDLLFRGFREREKSLGRGNVIADPVSFERAYSISRAIELGYRVGMIEQTMAYFHARESFEEVMERFSDLFEFRSSDSGWDTYPGIKVFSANNNPVNSRIKSLESSLLKVYYKLRYPDDITDYIAMELVVQNEEDRSRMIDYLRRRTRLPLVLEKIKKGQVSDLSGSEYRTVKFLLRIPVRTSSSFVRIPVEVQIYTQDELVAREGLEASHDEYKRRQFMRILPGLFPEQVYLPLLEEKESSV